MRTICSCKTFIMFHSLVIELKQPPLCSFDPIHILNPFISRQINPPDLLPSHLCPLPPSFIFLFYFDIVRIDVRDGLLAWRLDLIGNWVGIDMVHRIHLTDLVDLVYYIHVHLVIVRIIHMFHLGYLRNWICIIYTIVDSVHLIKVHTIHVIYIRYLIGIFWGILIDVISVAVRSIDDFMFDFVISLNCCNWFDRIRNSIRIWNNIMFCFDTGTDLLVIFAMVYILPISCAALHIELQCSSIAPPYRCEIILNKLNCIPINLFNH